MKQNRFGAFAEEDQVAGDLKQTQVAAKAADPKKKITIKVAKAPVEAHEGAEEFEQVMDQRNAPTQRGLDRGRGERGRGGRGGDRGGRGGDRGDRGGRGGDRGGRGGERGSRGGRGRGDRPEGENGERGRGDRRGRGRGDRPRTAAPQGEGEEIALADEKVLPGGADRNPRYQGKPREDAHPFDRQDGTGRGRRGDKKGGHGKGNWGKPQDGAEELKEGETRPERQPKEFKPREAREKKEVKIEEPKPEPVVEEEVGFTLDMYLAAKQAKSQGLYKKADVREKEKMDIKNIQESGVKGSQMQTSIVKELSAAQMYSHKPSVGSELLGFTKPIEEDEEPRRGGRGGRGGDNRPRQDRPNTTRGGGRKGGKIIVDDNDFPAL